jgi:membrane protease YdiL (CAAX protease family)
MSIRAFFGGYVGMLIAGVALCYLLHPISQLITRIVIALAFVAFLEEFFFRGYVQACPSQTQIRGPGRCGPRQAG